MRTDSTEISKLELARELGWPVKAASAKPLRPEGLALTGRLVGIIAAVRPQADLIAVGRKSSTGWTFSEVLRNLQLCGFLLRFLGAAFGLQPSGHSTWWPVESKRSEGSKRRSVFEVEAQPSLRRDCQIDCVSVNGGLASGGMRMGLLFADVGVTLVPVEFECKRDAGRPDRHLVMLLRARV